VNSSAAVESATANPFPNTQVVKQYGRRLVLSFENKTESTNPRNISKKDIQDFYGGESVVLDIENDLIVGLMQGTNVGVESILDPINMENLNELDMTYAPPIEWQYAADEPYGLQVEKLWHITNGSLETRIAVIDSGIAHVAREGMWFENLESGYDFISDPAISLDGDGRDADSEDPGDAAGPQCPRSSWHGSQMAYAIAGKHNSVPGLRSVAWNTTILPLRVLGACSTGYANDVTDAIVWAAGGLINGMDQNPNPAKIISMSFGGSGECPSYLQSAITMAINEYGAIVIAAAGNGGSDEQNTFPANCAGVVSVAASTRSGGLATYSNRGKTNFISAPGGDLLFPIQTVSIVNVNVVSTTFNFGTSFAAAFVSGFMALQISVYSEILIRQKINGLFLLENSIVHFNFIHDYFTKNICKDQGLCGLGILSANVMSENIDMYWNSAIQHMNESKWINDLLHPSSPLLIESNISNAIVQAMSCQRGIYTPPLPLYCLNSTKCGAVEIHGKVSGNEALSLCKQDTKGSLCSYLQDGFYNAFVESSSKIENLNVVSYDIHGCEPILAFEKNREEEQNMRKRRLLMSTPIIPNYHYVTFTSNVMLNTLNGTVNLNLSKIRYLSTFFEAELWGAIIGNGGTASVIIIQEQQIGNSTFLNITLGIDNKTTMNQNGIVDIIQRQQKRGEDVMFYGYDTSAASARHEMMWIVALNVAIVCTILYIFENSHVD